MYDIVSVAGLGLSYNGNYSGKFTVQSGIFVMSMHSVFPYKSQFDVEANFQT